MCYEGLIPKELQQNQMYLNTGCLSSYDTRTNVYQWFVDEAGLYRIIMRSDSKVAEVFRDWVCEEVLPSIRKQGLYIDRIFVELCVTSRQEAIPDVKTYFIRCNDKVKIGRTQDVQRRLEALQTANPDTLTLLGYIEGDLERYLHNKFQKHHFRGEWYYLDQEIMDFIKKETIL